MSKKTSAQERVAVMFNYSKKTNRQTILMRDHSETVCLPEFGVSYRDSINPPDAYAHILHTELHRQRDDFSFESNIPPISVAQPHNNLVVPSCEDTGSTTNNFEAAFDAVVEEALSLFSIQLRSDAHKNSFHFPPR